MKPETLDDICWALLAAIGALATSLLVLRVLARGLGIVF